MHIVYKYQRYVTIRDMTILFEIDNVLGAFPFSARKLKQYDPKTEELIKEK